MTRCQTVPMLSNVLNYSPGSAEYAYLAPAGSKVSDAGQDVGCVSRSSSIYQQQQQQQPIEQPQSITSFVNPADTNPVDAMRYRNFSGDSFTTALGAYGNNNHQQQHPLHRIDNGDDARHRSSSSRKRSNTFDDYGIYSRSYTTGGGGGGGNSNYSTRDVSTNGDSYSGDERLLDASTSNFNDFEEDEDIKNLLENKNSDLVKQRKGRGRHPNTTNIYIPTDKGVHIPLDDAVDALVDKKLPLHPVAEVPEDLADGSGDRKQYKRMKNSDAAKRSRLRKNLRLQTLEMALKNMEEKVNTLTRQISDRDQMLNEAKILINALRVQNEQLNQRLSGRNNL
ncbi:hypothetical protein MP228_004368 [Amoeboaphelidium protococcarum]|nr:hypothetical protein MP228_004368 [Amoeboaphelidium protococcarum]